jgi:hypothetical protein
MQPQTRQWSRALDEAFTIRLPFDPAVLLIHSFSGDPTKTFIQFDPSDSLSRQRIKNNGKWKWEEERIVYVVNTEAQAGKSLVILMGPRGTDIEGGTPAFQVENTSGATIDPSTEDKQDDAITELTALKTRLGEVNTDPTENTVLERLKALETAIDKLPLKAGTPTIYNVTLTSANTEYSQALPANTKRFSVHLRDYATFRVAYVTGKVAAPTAPYFTIAANGELYNEGLDASSKTLYLASPTAGKTAEIEVWA